MEDHEANRLHGPNRSCLTQLVADVGYAARYSLFWTFCGFEFFPLRQRVHPLTSGGQREPLAAIPRYGLCRWEKVKSWSPGGATGYDPNRSQM